MAVFFNFFWYRLLYVGIIETINATLWGTNSMSCERYFYITYIESMKSQNGTRWTSYHGNNVTAKHGLSIRISIPYLFLALHALMYHFLYIYIDNTDFTYRTQ